MGPTAAVLSSPGRRRLCATPSKSSWAPLRPLILRLHFYAGVLVALFTLLPFAHVAFPDGEQLTAWMDLERTVEEIAAELNCDSLAYLSLEGVYEAIRSTRATHCDACFSGDYPLAGTAAAQSKDAFEHALLPL